MSTARTVAPEQKPEQAGTFAHSHLGGTLSPALRHITNPEIVKRGSEDLPRKPGKRVAVVRHGAASPMTAQK